MYRIKKTNNNFVQKISMLKLFKKERDSTENPVMKDERSHSHPFFAISF